MSEIKYPRWGKNLGLFALSLLVLMIVGEVAEGAETMYVLCKPESYVCVREFPKKGAPVTGYLYLGDDVEPDGKVRNGYRHIVNLSTEAGEGWVHDGYLDYSETQKVEKTVRVAKGQTRVRSRIDGEVLRRLKKGTVLTVSAESAEWSITSVGYIRTELLTEVDD